MPHHLEIWVDDLSASKATLGWLLTRLGYRIDSEWSNGISYAHSNFYIVLESGPDVRHGRHERLNPGLNHLAFTVESKELVEQISREASDHGFTLMFSDQHPHAGGEQHYAAYLENGEGFEIELVAADGQGGS